MDMCHIVAAKILPIQTRDFLKKKKGYGRYHNH